MALQTLDVIRRSASTTPPPQARGALEVAKLIDISKCIGCKACQSACMEWNDLRDEVGTNQGTYQNPLDLTAQSWTLMRFYEEELPDKGLQWLIVKAGCPFNIPRYSMKDQKAYKCTLCSARVAVGLEPACIKTCPTQALSFGSKQAMKDLAHERLVELKARGFEQAALYD